MVMTEKKLYIPPHAEVVLVCNGRVCDDSHMVSMSNWTDGHGGGGQIGEGNGDGDAKGYGWDLWDDFEKDNW